MIDHCSLGYSVLYEYRGMDVRDYTQIFFHAKRPLDAWGVGGFANGCFKKKISKKSIFDKTNL